MKITLNHNETKSVMGLTLTNRPGGHEILMSGYGGKGGDLSFSRVECSADGIETQQIRMYPPNGEDKKICFGLYTITVLDMGWNGVWIELDIEKIVDDLT